MKDFNMHLNLGQGDLPRISARYLVHSRLAKLSRVGRGNRELLVAGRNDKMEKRKRMAIWD